MRYTAKNCFNTLLWLHFTMPHYNVLFNHFMLLLIITSIPNTLALYS